MNSSRGRLTSREFPPYTHRPGLTPHPEKPGGHSYPHKGIQTTPLQEHQAHRHQLYCYGLDLLNHGYFWESHVQFEAIWHAQGRKGVTADLLKALIKWGAAGVKALVESSPAAHGHLARCQELIAPISEEQGLVCIGLSLADWQQKLTTLSTGQELLDQHACLPELKLVSR